MVNGLYSWQYMFFSSLTAVYSISQGPFRAQCLAQGHFSMQQLGIIHKDDPTPEAQLPECVITVEPSFQYCIRQKPLQKGWVDPSLRGNPCRIALQTLFLLAWPPLWSILTVFLFCPHNLSVEGTSLQMKLNRVSWHKYSAKSTKPLNIICSLYS